MNVFMNKTDIAGIKNLKEQINLNYYKTIIGNEIKLNKTNIKAIYGPNGAGKSAIVFAYDIYHNLVAKTGGLLNETFVLKLNELINKETGVFSIGINFILFNDTLVISEYRHELTIAKNGDIFQIVHEKLIQFKSRSQLVIIETANGLIKNTILSKDLISNVVNQLGDRSIVELVSKLTIHPTKKPNVDDLGKVFPFILFANNLCVETADEEKSLEFVASHQISIDSKFVIEENIKRPKAELINKYAYVVLAKDLPAFKSYIKDLTRFLKIFKPDLQTVDITAIKYNNDEVIIEPHLIYANTSVFLGFESAGIKKLATLFRLFALKEVGKIVVIDELDASINDIYLLKLLEFFNSRDHGQLIFTTHNVTPMQVLANNKFALDFITQAGKITSWVKIGNYSPISIYQKGYINGLPFNIFDSDFLGVFTHE